MVDDRLSELAERADLLAEFDAALARLPHCLADARARASVRTLGRLLPRALRVHPLGLELRLAGPTAIDVFAAATPGLACGEAMMAALQQPLHSPGWADAQRARELANTLQRWSQRASALAAVARYLLVEVDAPADPGGAVAVPGIFLAPRGAHDRPKAGQAPNAFHRQIDATTMAVAELAGQWPNPATAEALARLVATLAGEAEIFAVGTMLGRAGAGALRVAIRRLPAEGIETVLQACGLAAQARHLRAALHDSPAARRVVHFEIGPGAEPRVGLELSPAADWKAARTEGWPDLLADLVARGLAEPERAAAVPALVDAAGEPLWGLAHAKIAADAEGVLPAAKLYVGLLHRQPPCRHPPAATPRP